VHLFLVTLHLIAVVLMVGPMVAAPFAGHRAIGRRSPDGVRSASTQLVAFGFGTLVAAALGLAALTGTDEYHFRTPWVIISVTLYAFVLLLSYLYTAPALRKAARLVIADPHLSSAEEVDQEVEPRLTATTADLPAATTADLQARARLDRLDGRILGSGLLILAAFVLIVILMVVKPFGS